MVKQHTIQTRSGLSNTKIRAWLAENKINGDPLMGSGLVNPITFEMESKHWNIYGDEAAILFKLKFG